MVFSLSKNGISFPFSLVIVFFMTQESSKPRSLKQVVMAGDVKVPLELTSEFTPYRLPVVLQGDKRVEGILTVI